MNKIKKGRLLGCIFILQAMTSLISGAVLVNPILNLVSSKKIIESILKSRSILHAAILIDSITAIGIIILAVLLFRTLSFVSKTASLIALSLYILEATILVFSKILLFMCTIYATKNSVDIAIFSTLLETVKFSYSLHLLPFAYGGFIFYFLLFKSHLIPKGLSLWGLISIISFIIGIPLKILQINVPFYIYLPYAPFEFYLGFYLLGKGFKQIKK